MKLLNLTLSNFKGVKALTISPGGNDISIYGDNATGKTTVGDALCWLLFDKDYAGNAQFEIKTLQADGEPIHQLQHEVEGVFDCGGKNITMKKVYTEKWTKKRGSSHSEFSGHSTDHFIDGVPVQKKDYSAKVAEIAPEEMFRLLTSPAYFASTLKWDKRREILLDVCGNVTDAEVIASSDALSPLLDILKNRTQEDHVKVVKATMSKINESLKQIPVRIDETLRKTSEGIDEDIDLSVEISKQSMNNKAIADLNKELVRIKEGGQTAEMDKQIATLESSIITMETDAKRKMQEQIDDLTKRERSAKDSAYIAERKIIALKHEETQLTFRTPPDTSQLDARMKELREEWSATDAMSYSYEEKTCQYCGQTIPEDPDAEAKFEDRKKRKLDEINKQGRELKKNKEDLLAKHEKEGKGSQEKIDKITAEIEVLATEVISCNETALRIQSEIDALNKNLTHPDEYHKAVAELEKLRDRRESLSEEKWPEIERINKEIDELTQKNSETEKRIALARQAIQAKERAEELRTEEKKLSKEYDRLAGELDILDRFTEAKVSLLEDKVAAQFDLARFKLFEKQINGGISPMCEVTYNGIPFGTNLNDGARINVGLDIIKTLSRHYGITLPVIIDNAESVTQLPPMDCQMIKLVVSGRDKKLRFEVEGIRKEKVA